MEREKEIGERSSLSLREKRNLREKERRMRMKDLFCLLSSHVSPTRRQLPVPKLIEQATSYMIQLKEKVKYLQEKKKTLLGGEVGCRSEGSSSSLLPKLSIHSRGSIIEMNLIISVNMKRLSLHELMGVFEEEGAQVMSANLQNLNDRTAYTIIAQAIISRIGIDPSRIEKRAEGKRIRRRKLNVVEGTAKPQRERATNAHETSLLYTLFSFAGASAYRPFGIIHDPIKREGSSFNLPKLSICSRGSIIKMNLIMDLNMKRVMLHELVSVFEEEGAQVMSANLQNLNDRITYTVTAQAIICRIGIDPSRIEERLRDIIF
ncbi:hypothetical protein IGI04_021749 [Brassica rapa subsp. trilocularis]|uniref:BHLH domain-containing protein n=1 Tax=Brassica rapa subsp. trilocularis TaxID=1813537 RepID=A0ABQ7LYY9_BRACM|nr:hypothetical protein IGI04_021749 [Brassica rapa subsp. trilocularis]